MTFVDASADVSVRGAQELGPYLNFFLGNDPTRWRSRVPTFDSVVYEGLYPGVDVELHRRQGRIEYDFILGAGVDPSVVRIRFDGVSSIELGRDGALLCHTAVGTLRQEPPVAFHRGVDGSRERVECSIVAQGDREFGFVVPRAVEGRVLVIDPQVGPAPRPDYFTYLGGTDSDVDLPDGMDQATDVVVSGGKAIVTGATASLDFPIEPDPGAVDDIPPTALATDVFVTQLDHDGTGLLWSTYLGGTTSVGSSPQFIDDEIGMGVCRTLSAAVYVTGFTSTTDFPTTTGVAQPGFAGFGDAFVARISGGGTTLDFATYLGGKVYDVGTGIATDVEQNVYVCGYTKSADVCTSAPCIPFPTTTGALEPNNMTMTEAGFLSKLDRTGALLQSTFVRTPSTSPSSAVEVRCWALDLDPDEIDPTQVDVWLSGQVSGASSPTDDFHLSANAFQPTFSGGSSLSDGFVLGLDSTFSSVLYGSYLGGAQADVGLGIDVYPGPEVAVVGMTESPGFPTVNAHQATHGGQSDGFYLRVDPSQSVPAATLISSSFFGDEQVDFLTDVVSDATGRNLYVTGASDYPGFVASWPGLSMPATVTGIDFNHGGLDTVLGTVTGFSLTFLVFMGGIEDDISHAIDLDFGSVTMAGSTVYDPNTPAVHFYAVLDNVDLAPGNGDPPGFVTFPPGGEAYVAGTVPSGFLAWPTLDQPAEIDAFVLRFDTP